MANTRQLNPAFRRIADRLLAAMRTLGPFVITSAYRSPTEQAQLYERFKRGEGGLYTVLPPGRSQHERGFAVDIARPNVRPKEDALLHAVGAWWRAQGGVWGGEADPVHFEAPKSWTGRG